MIVVNGPPRSGTGWFTMARAEQYGLPVHPCTLYYGPEDAAGPWPDKVTLISDERVEQAKAWARSQGVNPEKENRAWILSDIGGFLKVDWDEIKKIDCVIHAHIGYKFRMYHPDIIDHIQHIVRKPRNALTSAAKKWYGGDLVAMLNGIIATREYTPWVKDIMKFALESGFQRYDQLDWDSFYQSKTDWRTVWNDDVQAAWVEHGMDKMEDSLGYTDKVW